MSDFWRKINMIDVKFLRTTDICKQSEVGCDYMKINTSWSTANFNMWRFKLNVTTLALTEVRLRTIMTISQKIMIK